MRSPRSCCHSEHAAHHMSEQLMACSISPHDGVIAEKHVPHIPGMMVGPRILLIVADVDGTLLDGAGRLPFTAATLHEHLARLATAHGATCFLALASSRTLAELVVLQRALEAPGACIAEDGAVLAVDIAHVPDPAHTSLWRAGRRVLRVWSLGESATRLREALPLVADLYALDPTDTDTMATLGFRSYGAVRRALVERRASVLLDLRGVDERELASARAAANAAHAHLHRGGRWHTLTRGAGKGTATDLLRRLMTDSERATVRIVGIGNEENDATLLASADVAFAIRNPIGGVHRALASVADVIPLTAEGTAGFAEMLDRLADMRLFEQVVT